MDEAAVLEKKTSIADIEKLMEREDVELEILPDGTLKITESATAGEVVELIKQARADGDSY